MPDNLNQPIAVPASQDMITLDELYRQYGQTMWQFKEVQTNVMQAEQKIQQSLNSSTPPTDALNAEYGQVMIQFKIAQSKVIMLEQQLHQANNQPQQVK